MHNVLYGLPARPSGRLLVDEAHLAKHLVRLVPDLGECTRNVRPLLAGARTRLRVVSLTATGDSLVQDRFNLDTEDEANSIVRQRLDAPKTIRVRRMARDRDVVSGLVQETLSILEQASAPAACLVFANTPATARAVYNKLTSRSGKATDHPPEVVLLTGRTREREAERIRSRILDPVSGIPASRDQASPRERHLIVVATQTLEVGADVDAEVSVR